MRPDLDQGFLLAFRLKEWHEGSVQYVEPSYKGKNDPGALSWLVRCSFDPDAEQLIVP